MGENLYILGDIPELGNWKDFVCKLTWSQGHNWKTSLNLSNAISSFKYKFVCYNENSKSMKWEDGPDRVFTFSTSPQAHETHLKWNELLI